VQVRVQAASIGPSAAGADGTPAEAARRGGRSHGVIYHVLRLLRKARFWSLASVALASASIRRLIFGPARPSWCPPNLILFYFILFFG
jgi:hypothetical protein